MLTFETDDLLHKVSLHEKVEVTERVGFVEELDLITMREKLRKHGIQR